MDGVHIYTVPLCPHLVGLQKQALTHSMIYTNICIYAIYVFGVLFVGILLQYLQLILIIFHKTNDEAELKSEVPDLATWRRYCTNTHNAFKYYRNSRTRNANS